MTEEHTSPSGATPAAVLSPENVSDAALFLDEDLVHEEGEWDNGRGNKLWAQSWTPDLSRGSPKALMLMCHGYADHLHGHVGDICPKLAQYGYAVFGVDYEGCGKSSGKRAYHPDFTALVDDCYRYFKQCKAKFPSLPCFFYGESMGGCVALHLLIKYPDEFTGACLVAPMVKISEKTKPSPLVTSILTKISVLMPTAAIVPSADVIDASFKLPEKRQHIRDSPYAYNKKPRLKTALELLNASNWVYENMEKVSSAFLVLHGTEDTVNDISASRELVQRASAKDKTLLEYEGCWHALFGGETEETTQKIFSDMVSWLDARANAVIQIKND